MSNGNDDDAAQLFVRFGASQLTWTFAIVGFVKSFFRSSTLSQNISACLLIMGNSSGWNINSDTMNRILNSCWYITAVCRAFFQPGELFVDYKLFSFIPSLPCMQQSVVFDCVFMRKIDQQSMDRFSPKLSGNMTWGCIGKWLTFGADRSRVGVWGMTLLH